MSHRYLHIQEIQYELEGGIKKPVVNDENLKNEYSCKVDIRIHYHNHKYMDKHDISYKVFLKDYALDYTEGCDEDYDVLDFV